MNNIFSLMQTIKNPQAFIQQAMNNSQLMQNPIGKNAIEMFQKGDKEGLTQLANNLCKEKGTSYEEMVKEIIGLLNSNEYYTKKSSNYLETLQKIEKSFEPIPVPAVEVIEEELVINETTNLKEVFSILSIDSQELLKGFESEGLVDFSMRAKGELSKETLPQITADFNIEKGGLKNKKLNVSCQNINLKGSYSNYFCGQYLIWYRFYFFFYL